MSGLISYSLDDGGHVLIEVEEDIKGTVAPGLHPGAIIETAGTKFETAIGRVGPEALAVARNFRGFVDAPEDVDVAFGLKFAGQAGVIIALTNTKAQFHIKMVWKGKPATPAT